uniref:CHHC U11-48K-type domain-containing protein n=1 Tax=Anolis carolinensis TaxID=28377 RepID=A0A803TBD3_ANOCA
MNVTEDNNVKDVEASNSEKLLQCPYDKSHQIRACRFPYHLVKCRKHHPGIIKSWPFNDDYDVIHFSWQPCPCDGDWDKEVLEDPPPASAFIWGTSCSENISVIRSCTTVGNKNHQQPVPQPAALGLSLQAPKSLPPSVLPTKHHNINCPFQ